MIKLLTDCCDTTWQGLIACEDEARCKSVGPGFALSQCDTTIATRKFGWAVLETNSAPATCNAGDRTVVKSGLSPSNRTIGMCGVWKWSAVEAHCTLPSPQMVLR